MKPQKKAVVARKATKMPTVAKKRRTFIEKTMSDVRKEKKSKKNDKIGDSKKKMDNDKKKLEKMEDKKKFDDKKKMEEKRKERSDKPDEKKKQLSKDYEKKSDKIDEKKIEKGDDKTNNEEISQENMDKKKLPKCEEKVKLEKQSVDNKKKIEKTEEKKKNIKFDDNVSMEDNVKSLNTAENKDAFEDKIDALSPPTKKRSKDEKKKDVKLIKSDIKTLSKSSTVKDKKSERKKISEKDAASNKLSSAKTKKDSKAKQGQKKSVARKTVLTKKPHLSVVKRLVDKKIKLVKPIKSEEISEDEDAIKKTKKKNSNIGKNKILQEKKPKLAKHMKAKLPQKHSKISAVLKREDKLKAITEKIMARKKIELKESEETEHNKKIASKDEACQGPEVSSIKSEIIEDSDKRKEENFQAKLQDKKAMKSGNKISSRAPKKAGKTIRVQTESNNQTSALSEDVSSEEFHKQTKVSEDGLKSAKQEQIGAENAVVLDLKVEAMNGESASGVTSQSDSEDDFDDEYKKGKQKDVKNKDRANSPSDERARGMRLFGFWSKPKPPRVASLNALAKVHCLYENETGGVYLGGFCKSKPEREKEKPKKMKEEKEEQPRKEKEKKAETCKTEDNVSKRKLRNVPGLRGKHWDMMESSSSSSSSDEDCEKEKNAEPSKKRMTKRRKKNEEVMDLKDMVVCKRMASLNATAILAASYSDEKNLRGSSSSSSSSSDTSSDSEIEIIKRRRQNDLDVDKKKSRQGSDPEEVKPSKKVVIVNQDTDVTITGNSSCVTT